MADWTAKGEPLGVDEDQDNGDPTDEEIAEAQANWDHMEPSLKAWLTDLFQRVGLPVPGESE